MFVKQVTRECLIIGAPAKVNLFLEVLGKRDDGYHNINSLFQTVSLFDRLRFTRVEGYSEASIRLTEPSELPTDNSNLITQAYCLMRDRFDLKDGLRVELEKNIPVAAGLAGGSADGAATILACTILYELPLDRAAMAELSLELGSDLPFFFSRGQAIVRGRGEEVTETDFPTDYWLVLVTPELAISSAESYAALSLGLTKPKYPFSLRRCGTAQELLESLELTGNDFEEGHLRSYPQLGKIKDGLLDNGALLSRMSGSGPTVFGLYIEAPGIEDGRLFGREDWRGTTVVRPVILPSRLPLTGR